MRISRRFLAVPLAIGLLFVAGCGGGDSDTTPTVTTQTQMPSTNGAETTGAGTTLELAADPNGALAYVQTELTAPAGKVTIDFTNESPMPHDVVVQDADGNEVARTEIFQGGTRSAEFTAEAGTYTYYCSVPGHGAMKGTITVQ